MSNTKNRIVIEISGGCVTAVYTDDDNVDVIVADYDNIAAGDPNPLDFKPEEQMIQVY